MHISNLHSQDNYDAIQMNVRPSGEDLDVIEVLLL